MDIAFDSLYYRDGESLAGIDEVGISDIAGPLVAACVVLPRIDPHKNDLRIFEVNDSKRIPARYRKQYAEIVWQEAVAIGIGEVSATEVDYFRREVAIRLAGLRAVAACRKTSASHRPFVPDRLLIDGKRRLPIDIDQEPIVDGDAKSLCIASASIVAKVYRDELMVRLHAEFPYYNWAQNKGHPTEEHLKGLDSHGIRLGIHRLRSWPFADHYSKARDPELELRRRKWREATKATAFDSLKERLWTTARESSQPSMNSTNGLEPEAPQS